MIGLFRRGERRALDASKFGLAIDNDYVDTAGVAVNQDTALRSSPFWSAVRLLTNDISSLPLNAFRERAGSRDEIALPSWADQPIPGDPSVTREDHFAQVLLSMLLDGNSFTLSLPGVFDPAELIVLDPRKVEVSRNGRNVPSYKYKDGDSAIDFGPEQIVHIPLWRKAGELRGLSPVQAMAQTIGRGLAAEETGARYFGQGSILGGVVEYPIEAGDPDDAAVKDLLKQLNNRHRGIRKSWALGALTQGAKFHELTMKPSDSQLIETEKWTLEQAARFFGIPPYMIGSQEPGAVGYASVEQRAIDYVSHAVVPLTIRIERAYSRMLPRGSYVKFNIRGLLRGDIKTRFEAYQVGLQSKFMRREEVRELEDLPFDAEGAGYLETPNNNPPSEPAPAPAGTDRSAAELMADILHRPVNVTVPEPRVTVNLPAVEPPQVTVNVPPQEPPVVNVEAPIVNVTAPEPRKKRIVRDARGRITGMEEV